MLWQIVPEKPLILVLKDTIALKMEKELISNSTNFKKKQVLYKVIKYLGKRCINHFWKRSKSFEAIYFLELCKWTTINRTHFAICNIDHSILLHFEITIFKSDLDFASVRGVRERGERERERERKRES